MDYKKNDTVTVTIEDMGQNGEGIGKIAGYTLFVKDALIGDMAEVKITKAKKNYGYARLMRLIEPSADRVGPLCPFARACGGCQLQELSYEKQLEFKEQKVKNNLMRLGGFAEIPMEPIIGMDTPFYYRNKAQFPVGKNREGRPVTGFYAGRTHSIIENHRCYLGVPVNEEILDDVMNYVETYGIEPYDEETGRGLLRHVLIRFGFRTKEIMVCLVVNGRALPHSDELVKSLTAIGGMTSITLNVNTRRDNVILGEEILPIWGQTYITDYIGETCYQISPLSFYQVNPAQTEKLYGLALEYAGLTGRETVWDLYCGIGTISLFLARHAKEVHGVEIVPAAIEDARENARRNGIENASFYVGRAEEVLPDFYANYEKEHPGLTARADVIVVDPPRKGCEETLLDTMVKMQPKRIVYVSCDSATLARDLKYLCNRGYELRRVRAIDQFGMTTHCESIALLVRRG